MIDLTPPPIFNPVTATTPLTALELLAGPFGLLAFAPLIPLTRWLARESPASAIILTGIAWVVATAGPGSAAVLIAGLAIGVGWVRLVGNVAASARLSGPAGIAAVWIGLSLLLLPLWWFPAWSWYGWTPSRLAVLHNLGFAYFYLRLVGWGVDMVRARDPEPLRLAETIAWLAYPPCMRLGPILPRRVFLERLAAWTPRTPLHWRDIGRRFGLLVIGGATLAVLAHNLPKVSADKPDFFSAPQLYSTDQLLRIVFCGPTMIYFLLWTYNELAATLALLVGLPVDNNFNWLPAATSIRDFWRRWHVTVGGWLREYVYIPLGGNRRSPLLTYPVVFAFCGVWHGASWSFLAWGLSQAIALMVQRGWDVLRNRLGWDGKPSGPAWTAFCWLITLQYQLVTVLVFVDFNYCATRLFANLAGRLLGGG
ncbi:MAG: hypothetical protein HZB38_06600 [Planctomycetes bacterium]|nr:hypothetical protein [Planctomycetota bacterium]